MKKRSTFNLSHENKFSFRMGYLVPSLCTEVLPGDTFHGKTDALVRLAPQLAPTLSTVNLYSYTFFVPSRLLWNGTQRGDDWETFITGGTSGTASPAKPTITFTDVGNNTLADYLGLPYLPQTNPQPITVDAMPFRAYNLIYNEWFRDQNLQNEVPISFDGGNDTTTSTALLKKNWGKDYFTTCLPNTQRGNGAFVPVTGQAPVIGNGVLGITNGQDANFGLRMTGSAGDDFLVLGGSAAKQGGEVLPTNSGILENNTHTCYF